MPYANTTLSQLLTRLAERTEGAVFWSASSATLALTEAIRLWSLFTGLSRLTVTVSSVATDPANPYIELVSPARPQFLKVTRVRVPSPARELNPTSLAGLDASFPGWEAQTTLTSPIATAPRYWAPAGMGRIAIFPADAPISAGGNGPRSLAVDAIACANILVAPTDFLDIGDEDLTALLGYALHVLSFSKGADALRTTRPLYLAFLKAAADRNAVFAASSFYRKIIGQDWTRMAQPLRAASSVAAAGVLVESQGNAGQAG
jgi:hypothetical protein